MGKAGDTLVLKRLATFRVTKMMTNSSKKEAATTTLDGDEYGVFI